MRDAVLLGDDGDRIRIPLDKTIPAFDLGPIVDEQSRAVRNPVPGLFPPGLVQQHTGRVDHDVSVLHLHSRVEGSLHRGLFGAALRGAANVEGAHRQLRAGLADRLRSDDTDRLTDIDNRTARQIAPVALAADADTGLAGQHRADWNGIDTGALDLVDRILVD